MKKIGQYLATGAAVFMLAAAGWCRIAWAQGQPITFSVMGDQPYGSDEFAMVNQFMIDHNRYSPSEFLVHVGDIKAHNEPCTAERFAITADFLKQLAVPTFVIVGDNEWTDCNNPSNAWDLWAALYLNFENNFCHNLSVAKQGSRPDNFAFVSKGVLFVGINLVGGTGHPDANLQAQVVQDDIAWVSQQLQDNASQVRAAVVFGQAGPGAAYRDVFFDQFAIMGASFGKPVLYISGDIHVWKEVNNFLGQSNMKQVVVKNDTEQPLEVTVTMAANPFQLKRNPWITNPQVFNMPPCVKAGPDQSLTEVFSAALNGQASDDGDPQTPGTLALTWSKVSGPGAATFDNPNAAQSNVTVNLGGTYVLRLTADDGELQTSDEMTIDFEQLTPAIAAFTPIVGPPGTEVTLTGDTFNGATGVTFNGVASTNFVIDSNTQLRAIVPAGAATGRIVVTNDAGSGESADDFIVPSLPAITSFSPSNGPVGIEVTITGTDFLTTSSVSFNGPASPSFTIDSDTQLRAIVPAAATTGKIFVTNAVGLGSSANNFLVVKLPAISSFTPAHGPAGAEITITGTNFSVVTNVTFNGAPAASFIVDSQTQIRAFVPAGATIGKIGVANSAGLGLSANDFIVTGMPVIGSFTPADGPVGTAVTLAGEFFATATAVTFNGATASFTVLSDTSLQATVPAGATTGKIAVTNSIGTTPSINNFIVTVQPAVTSFTPGNGPFGAEITVRGSNFAAITDVQFNGVSSNGFTVDSPTQIRAVVPAGAATGKISVTNSAGTGQSAINFIVTVISLFEPSNGPVGSEVVITGTQFNSATGVNFNDVAASFTIDSDTQIRATVPAGAATGKIAVIFPPGPAFTADDFIVTTEPAITSFSPIDGPIGTEVTVRGTGFLGTTSVTFNGIPSTSFLVESDIQLRATVPSGATTGKITLFNSAGSGVSANDFIVTAQPVITSFAPASDTAGAVVTITGSKFTAITSVAFGSAPAASFIVDSPTQIRATIPVGAITGKIGAANSAGTGLSANNFVVLARPVITSLAPGNGVAGAEITITGSHFAAVTSVTFNGTPAASFAVDSETQIRATVPNGATSGKIGITNTVGTGLSGNNFNVTTVTSFAPANGTAGAEITLTGTHFANVTGVSFNGVAAANFTIDSATQLRATVPASATTGKIAVTIAAGTTGSANDFFVTRLPVISSFSPVDGPPGTEVTLTGTDFTFISQVAFNGAPAQSFTTDSETQIRAVTPADVTTGRITVTNSAGTGTSAGDFVVTGIPVISSFAPLDGPIGTEVTINGDDFIGTTSVTFNDISTTTFAIESNTRIRAIVPPAATTGKIRVINSAGSGLSANDFLVTQSPLIFSFDPAIGIIGSEVTIAGNHFLGTSAVSFNGVTAAGFSIDSNTQVRAIIPDGATTGKIGVTNSAGTGFSGGTFTVKPPPVISAFTPADGPAGTEITITGEFFTGLTAVSFNGIAAGSFAFDSDTQIRAVVPAGAATGKIRVTTADGTRLSAADFIVTQLPVITAFSPLSAPVGSEIAITGNHFEVITGVSFGGAAAASFTVDSNTQIHANVPAGAVTGKIGVSNSAGTGMSNSNFTVIFTPQITAFVPANGVAGTEVTIKGNNFIEVTNVTFNGAAAASFTVESDTVLRAAVPAGATPGKISVANASGTGTSADDFQVLTFSAFTPEDGPVGGEVTLTGTHFTSATGVKFNGVAATNFTIDSGTQLRVTVPAGAATGKIVVSNAMGAVTSANDFIVTRVPVISSFAPGDGPVNTEVTAVGTYFTRVTSVKFNGVTATSLTVDSDTHLRANVPTGVPAGASTIVVTNSAGSDTSANDFVVTVAPVIAAMTPGNGPVGAEITMTGENFLAITQVAFNGTAAASFTAESATQLRATVPAGATTGKIRITNSSGTGESAEEFIVTKTPAITSFTPNDGPVASQATIIGDNFAGTASVTFNGIAASFAVESNTQLRAFVPAGASTGKIVVNNSAGTATSADDFVVTAIPAIAAFAPGLGIVGNEITLTGSDFIAITSVKFNGTAVASFTVDSPAQIRAVVPPGASTGKIAAANSAGEGQSANDFEVFTFASFAPATGPFGAEVVISGAELDEVSSVKINGATASFTVDSKTQLRAVVPNGASTGKIAISTASGLSLISATDFIVTFPPTITAFSPSDGPVGSEVIVTGTNFAGTASVTFNGTAASSFTIVSTLEIRATVPAGASNGKIAVINSAGTAETAEDFVVTDTPVITAFTPADGPAGTEVTIDGQNFFNVNGVAFNGTPAAAFIVISVNQIRATVPASATTGPISVTNSVGAGSSTENFIVSRSPSIFSFTPTIGAEGSMVTITGNNFDGTSAVKFNGTASTNFMVDSNTQIAAQVPVFATTGKISVTNSAGIAVSGGTFTVKPPPVISSFTPAQGPAGTEITINGLNFTGLTGVAFNGAAAASFVFVSDTRIRATIPAGATTGKISVSTSNGTRQSVGSLIVIQIPQITLLSPADGPVGAAVNIVGAKFTGTTQVKFNGVLDPGFTLVSDTLIQATVPGGATTGKISLTNAAGTGQSAGDFIVTITPAIFSFQPGNGPIGSQVTITGNNFAATASVTFNGISASDFTVDSNTQIHVTVPAGAATGKIGVANSAGSAAGADDFVVTSTPVISFFTPGDGSPGTQVTITGENFLFVSGVTFNGAAANFIVDSPTQIRATTPSNVATGKIGVTNSAGTGLSVTDFSATPAAGFSFSPLHDTYVRSSTPTTNNGTAGSLRSETGTLTDRTYLKFNVTGLSAPVSSAKLRLFVANASVDGGTVYLVSNNYANTTTPWTETGLVWNNAPAISGAPVVGAAGVVNASAWIEVNVTAAITSNGTYSLALQCASTDRVQYNSKESASNRPVLLIETLSGSATFPMLTAFAPPDGPTGTQVTITGSNFTHVTGVTFNGIAAAGFTIDSDTQIRATVPVPPIGGTLTGKITIANSNGAGQSAVDFIVTKIPVISSFTPVDGPVGVEAVVTGSNFAAISGVTFNGAAASGFTVETDTRLRATLPIGATSGKIGVTNSAGTGSSANDFIVTKAPLLAAFNPSNGPVGSELTITGDNFIGVASVAFNGVTATNFIFDSNTQLRATVPIGATTGKIAVINSAGAATSVNDFIVTTVPVITSFTPDDGPVGTEVRISGRDFILITGVSFNGIAAASFTVDADTLLRATVPAGATNGKIGVSNSAGTGLSGNNFIVTETPALTAFTPADGPAGSQVTITGNNFLGAASVKFNGLAAANFTVDSDTQILATVPVGATTGKIEVTNSAGAAASTNDFVVTTLPVISSFTPADGPVATEVRISGLNFVAITGVTFNGTATSFTVDADTLLRAPVPAGIAGTAKIIVRNSAGADTSAADFIVTLPPVITSFAPLDGPEGAEVTLTGSRFLASTSVNFNGVAATQFTVDSDTKLRVIVPPGATTNKISVTNSAGTGISAIAFIVTKVPMITAFAPADGPVGTEVAINGTNFTAVTKVAFGEVNAASFAVDSPTKIRAGVPAGATVGKIAVTNSAGIGASLSNFTVTAVPSISAFTPANAPVGTEVTLTGGNFIAINSVTFNNMPAANFTVDSATQLRVQVPAGATAGKIRVTNSAGFVDSGNDFVVTATPAITAFTPNDGPVGSEIMLTGANFFAIASVKLNGVAVTDFTVDSATQLRLTVPLSATTGRIIVTNSAGADTTASDFVLTKVPVIVSFAPPDGPVGTEVTITGRHFLLITGVTFNGTAAANFAVLADTLIRATVPAGATAGKIGISNSAGTGFTSSNFIVTSGPGITSFTPPDGPSGAEIVITGANLLGTSSVTFNGTSSANFTVISNTQMRATVPAGAASGKIGVVNSAGAAQSANNFIVTHIPVIAALAPDEGPVGTEIVITGNHFTAVSSVKINGTADNNFAVNSDAEIRAHVPAGAASGRIIITNSAGADTSANQFTVTAVPQIVAAVPADGPAGTEVVIKGRNFVKITQVTFNSMAASFTVESDSLLRTTVPAGATTGKIGMTNSAGTGQSANDFIVTSIPAIASFSPSNGPIGAEVTIGGTGFAGTSLVSFNGMAAASFSVESDLQLRATVPSGATTGRIIVGNSAGADTSASDFTVTAAPAVAAFTPADGPAGTEVKITGSNFLLITSVTFNGVNAASFVVDSLSQIRAVVPAGAGAGKIKVTNSAGAGESANNFIATVLPVITSLTPGNGPVGAETVINGTGFSGASQVSFNGVADPAFVVEADTQIRAHVPAGATAGKIIVKNSAGEGMSADDFIVIYPPVVASFTPMDGSAGTRIAITGENFISTSQVTVSGVAATNVTVESATLLRATVAPGTATGKIAVTNAAGTGSSVDDFVVLLPNSLAFTPIHDAHVNSSQPTTNYGNSAALHQEIGAATRRTYLKFEISGLGAPVLSAKLRFYVVNASVDGGAVYSVSNNYEGTGTPWIESGLNWNNAPAISGTPLSSAGTAVLNSFVELDVTAAVTGNGTFSFGLMNNHTDRVEYSSSEGAQPPALLIETVSGSGTLPVITAFGPANGPAGAEVTISGYNFTGATNVSFNGVLATNVTVDSDTQIRVLVPAGATTGKISITNLNGNGQSADDFVVTMLSVIAAFTPTDGPAGTEVTITGSQFVLVTAVNFNGTPATSFTVDSPAQIRATVPAGASTGKIGVANSAGTGFSAGNFIVTAVPVITSFTPTDGAIGAEVTITGVNFQGVSQVTFNGGAAVNFTVVSPAQIHAAVPIGAATGKIIVINSAGADTSANDFLVTVVPEIFSFTPNDGVVGTEVRIRGLSFVAIAGVTFNGTPADSFVAESDTVLRAIVPIGAASGKLGVSNSAGTGFSSGNFIVPAVPQVASFTPPDGPAGAEITITGTNFLGASGVTFSGTPSANFIVISNTQMRATVPAGAASGKIGVVNSAGSAQSANNFIVTHIPVIAAFAPEEGPVGTEIAITGDNFTATSRVAFNGGADSSFVVISDSLIRAHVPAGAATGRIIVTNSAGADTSANQFTVTAVPQIVAAVPADGPLGAEVAIKGRHFVKITQVTFNGVAASFTVESDSLLRATVPVGAATGKIGITNSAGAGQSANDFIVTSIPAIASFSPSNGPVGAEVTINGTGFAGISQVIFNGIAATNFTVDSGIKLRATVPSGATTSRIIVGNSAGADTSASDFTVTAAPAVAAFTPADGPADTEVKITGSNFLLITSVTFNGVNAASFVVDSLSQIRAVVPAGAGAGKIKVINSAGVGESANNFIATVPPVIASFTPDNGPVGAEIVIDGTGFSGVSTVSFNGVADTAFAVESDTRIRAHVPDNATTGKIVVANSAGADTSANEFLVVEGPLVAAFAPADGSVGTRVVITGRNFSTVSQVTFNGVAATGLTIDSDTQLQATVPAGATTGKIGVVNTAGTGASANDFVVIPPNNLSFTPIHDAHVNSAQRTTNYGNSAALHQEIGAATRRTYLKFEISGLGAPVLSAKLRFYVANASVDGGAAYAVSNNYQGTSTPWIESGLNWNNAPAISGTPLSSVGMAALNSFVEFEVTAAVTGNGTFSFGLMNNHTDRVEYSSSEGAQSPALMIETLSGSGTLPTITSFAPANGPAGAEVTIAGYNFTGTTSVSFNGVLATNVTVDSDTQIRAFVPAGATTGKISIANLNGNGQGANDFVVTMLPVIAAFTPADGPAGTEVTIAGNHFVAVTGVTFNGAPAAGFTVDSAAQIRAMAPAGVSTGKIGVTNSAGTGFSANDFVVTAIPAITSFTPNDGPVGSEMTITGANFIAISQVMFNGAAAANFTVNSPAQIHAVVPLNATTGKIVVANSAGADTSANDFLMTVVPEILSFTPNDGPVGTEVRIRGLYFVAITGVAFNGTPASSFVVESDTVLRAIVPLGTTSGKLGVSNSAGTGFSVGQFIVPAVPQVVSFTPPDGPVGAEITITGLNLLGVSSVDFNGIAGSFAVISNTQIRAQVPDSATTGKIKVTNAAGFGQSANDFVVTQPPVIASFAPDEGPVGTEIAITGDHFIATSHVAINGVVDSSFVVISDSLIRAHVPAGAATGRIIVINSAGADTSANQFTVTAAPQIVLVTPADGPIGTAVVIKGRHFAEVTNVAFNGVAASFTVDSDSVLHATVPAGAITGKIGITNSAGVGQSANDFIVTAIPVLASVSPNNGPIGAEVAITGTGFAGISLVSFNGVAATNFTVDADTLLRAAVPSGSATGKIIAANSAGADTSASDFTVTTAPAVAAFTPASGPAGTEVKITGNNFLLITSVTFNGVNAASFVVDSLSQIRAVVPLGAATGKIKVANSAGTGESVGDFAVIQPPAITSFTPTSGEVGTEVTISGSNFISATGVTFNGVAATVFTIDSDTQLHANVPAGAGTGKIGVSNLADTVASAGDFTVTLPPTTLTFNPVADAHVNSASPNNNYGNGANIRVEEGATQYHGYFKFVVSGLNGTVVSAKLRLYVTNDGPAGGSIYAVSNNSNGSASPWTETGITWNTAPVISGTLLSVAGPAVLNTYLEMDVTAAINGDGAYSFGISPNTTNRIEYSSRQGARPPELMIERSVSNAPLLSAFTPASGVAGTEVTVTGSNFIGVTGVKFNGAAASFTVDSNTQIRANVPAGASTGKVSVSNADGAGVSAGDFVIIQPPAITSFTPLSGPVGAEVTISGSNFIGATGVTFNGVAATIFTVDSGTLLRANIPAGASTGKIGVINAAGAGASANNFQVTFAPVIASFTPASGPAGAEVTITGNNFTGVTGVAFNGKADSSFIVDSATQIRAKVPAGATTGKISLSNADGSGVSADDFAVIQPPAITSFTPTSGEVGTEVTISGSNFISATGVTFNGVAATVFTIDSDTQLRANVPAGAGTGKIGVSNLADTVASAGDFTVTLPPATLTFNPVADAHVNSASPNNNYGNGANIRVEEGATQYHGYLKFEVSGLNGVVLSAKLRLYVTNDGPAGGSIYLVSNNSNGSASPWTETGITWNTAPVISGTPLSVAGPAVLNTYLEMDVTAAINGDGAYSFGISPNTTNRIEYSSRQGARPPELMIERSVSNAPLLSAFTPASGVAGTEVTVTGSNFIGVTGVKFNGAAASFTVDSNTQIRANVPAGASTGKISVSTAGGTVSSADNFTVAQPPAQFTLTVQTVDSGKVVLNPLGGIYNEGTVVTLTAIPKSGWQFSGWSGDLSGSTNPATITMNGNKNVTATFAVVSSGGPIAHEETQTGGSANSAMVKTSAPLTPAGGHLYLAAISTQLKKNVVSVSGLGLSWTLVKAQCSGVNTTGVEVWMAQMPVGGTSSGDNMVTATLDGAASATVIAVSRYSGADAANPIGTVISGNTNGANGSCSGGVASSSYSFDLATTANEALIYGAVAIKARTHTPGAGYTERAEIKQVGGGLTCALAVEDMAAAAATVTVDGSLSGTADWAAVAVAIRPPGAAPAQYTLAVNTVNSGSVSLNPPGGSYEAGAEVTLTATPAAGFAFSGWSGDLSGSTNPATITMNGNKNVTATFAVVSSGGPIAHEQTQTGGSANSAMVKTSAPLTPAGGHLYLAAISTQPRKSVLAVSGLGLSWTLVKAQCSGVNTTGIEVWMAQMPVGSTPSSDDTVTATLAGAPSAAVIAVSRYSGANALNPIGNMISGNTNGASGICSGGVASSAYSFNLTTVNEAFIYGAVAIKARTHTPGPGYTERAEIKQVGGALTSALAVEDKKAASAGAMTVDGLFNGTSDWALVAVEIKPSVAGASLASNDLDINDAAEMSKRQPDDLTTSFLDRLTLHPNYPNPFNAQTTIEYTLPMEASAQLFVFNMYGQVVRRLVNGRQPAGTHRIVWDGKDARGNEVSSGVYHYHLRVGRMTLVRQMTVVK